MRARWASPKSRSNEATGYLVDLIYAPFIVIVEEKKKKKRELSISQRKSYKTLFKQCYATVDSALGACNQCTGPGQCTRARMQSSATYIYANRPGRYAARCRSRIPPCPNVLSTIQVRQQWRWACILRTPHPRLGYRKWTSTTCNTSIYPAPWQAPLSNQSLPRMNKHHVQH